MNYLLETELKAIGGLAPLHRGKVSAIVESVAAVYEITPHDLMVKFEDRRSADTRVQVAAYQVAVYLIRELTMSSFQSIAIYLRRTSHSTIKHAYRQAVDRRRSNPRYAEAVDELRTELIREHGTQNSRPSTNTSGVSSLR